MHIIIGLISLISLIAVWYWRIKVLSEAAKDGAKIAQTVKNMPRKMSFKRKSGRGGLEVVDDPREAAAILMLEVAKARGALTDPQQATIRAEIIQHFEFTDADAAALISQAEFLARSAPSAQSVMTRMASFLQSVPALGAKELVDMDSMLVAVSEAEGTPTAEQLDLIEAFRRKIGLQV